MKKTYIAPEMVIDSMVAEELICLSLIDSDATNVDVLTKEISPIEIDEEEDWTELW